MKIKTLFKVVSGLAITSSLVPFSVAYNNTHTHTQDSLNVGNSNQSNVFSWDIDDKGIIHPHRRSQIGESITIPSNVSGKNVIGIKEYAFQEVRSLKTVTFEANNNFTIIGEGAFQGCANLETITLPSSLTTIKRVAFFECKKLKNINIPEKVTSIGDQTFYFCSSLTSISIPGSVEDITGLFNKCIGLTSVVISNGVSNISGAFADCSALTSISIPSSVTTINGAFKNCSALTSIAIPNSVTSIGDRTFEASGLKEIVIPNSVTTIGARAFESCIALSSINIPNSVTSIGETSFARCSLLTSLNVNWTNDQLKNLTLGEQIFSEINTVTINAKNPDGRNHDELLSKYQEIFTTQKTGATSITINVDPDQPDTFWDIDANGVIWPKNGVTIPAELHIPKAVVNSQGVKTLVKKIKDRVFYNNSTITSLVFDDLDENQNIEIGRLAFYGCSKLANVNISKGVGTIQDGAFTNCSKLTNINIPDSVTDIGKGVFSGCVALTSVNIPDSVTTINTAAFLNCSALTNISLPNSVTSISPQVFSGCSSLTSITIPNSVTDISNETFKNCTALTAISIPNSVTHIWYDAFAGCSLLTSITIPNSVTIINSRAFNLNSTNNVNVQIRQDIDHADEKSCDALKNEYKTKLTEAGLTNPTTYTTWFDSNTNSPSETFDVFNLNTTSTTTIASGFKAWKDEKSSNRSITLKYTTSDNSISATGTLDDNLSTITTTITGNIPNIEAKDVTFTPQLRLRDNSSNDFEKVINLQSGTIHLSANNNSNETHQLNKNTVINNNRDGLWIPGDSYSINIDINKAYFGAHYNDKEYIKTHFDEFINVEGKSTYTFNHNQGTNIYTHSQIGQLEVANIEESNHDWQITLKFTLPESDQYKLLTQSINFIPKLDPTKGTMFSLLTKSIDEYDPNWNGLEPENLTLPFNEQNGTVIWNDTDQNKVKALGNTNTCKWAVSKGYRLEISDFTNEFIGLDQQATFDVNANQLKVNFKKLKQIVENQSVNLSGLKLLIKDGNNVIKQIDLPDLAVTLSVQHFNWVPLLTSIFSTILVVGLCATFGVYLKEKRTKKVK